MSIAALNWAWEQTTPNPTSKLVLLALADHANGDGECWPSMKKIAVMAQVSARQVSYHITMLEKLGLVEKQSRRRWEGQLRGWNYRVLTSGSQLPVASGSPASSPAEATFRSEPPENHQIEPLAAAPREKKPRARDPIWDAIVEACGYVNPTGTEAGRAQKAGKELRQIGATPEQVHQVVAAYRKKWPDMPVTPQALTGNWNQLLETAKPRKKSWSETNWCPDCQQDADDIYHEELCDAYQRHR